MEVLDTKINQDGKKGGINIMDILLEVSGQMLLGGELIKN